MAPGSSRDEERRNAARETIDILHEMSTLLDTGLDRQALSYCVSLIENGVNPEALAKLLRDVRDGHISYENATSLSDRAPT